MILFILNLRCRLNHNVYSFIRRFIALYLVLHLGHIAVDRPLGGIFTKNIAANDCSIFCQAFRAGNIPKPLNFITNGTGDSIRSQYRKPITYVLPLDDFNSEPTQISCEYKAPDGQKGLESSPETSGMDLESEAIPGDVTESDVWKMKAAISQNATLGIDWVKTIESLQTSKYCTVSPLTIAYNSALSAAEKNCNADLCLDILSDMKKRAESVVDAVSYKLSISACIKCNRVEEAIKLQEEMLEEGLTLDHGTIRSLLWLLSANGKGSQAVKLFEILKNMAQVCKNEKGLIQTDYLHTIESCLLSDMFQDALDLYKQLRKSPNYSLDSKALKTLLELAHSLGDSEMCMELYSEAFKKRTLELSLAHLKLVLSTLLMDSKFEKVDLVWKNILNENVIIDKVLCNLVMQSYAMSGDFQNAIDLLTLMDKESFLHTSQPYLLAIASCRKCGEWTLAIKILRMAQKRLGRPGVDLYNAVLEVCAVAKEWDAMVALYQETQKGRESGEGEPGGVAEGLKPHGDTIAHMLIAYYHLGDEEKTRELLAVPVRETPLLSKLRKSLTQS